MITKKVTNPGQREIFRAGYNFPPGETIEIAVADRQFKEIKACRSLKIAAAEEQNVCEVCGFVAKTEGGLRFHKKGKHEGKKVKK